MRMHSILSRRDRFWGVRIMSVQYNNSGGQKGGYPNDTSIRIFLLQVAHVIGTLFWGASIFGLKRTLKEGVSMVPCPLDCRKLNFWKHSFNSFVHARSQSSEESSKGRYYDTVQEYSFACLILTTMNNASVRSSLRIDPVSRGVRNACFENRT
jgi:hypothetical protein